MEGSLYRKFSISWRGTRFQGPNSGFLLAGTWSVPLSGTRGSGSCLEVGGNDTGVFFPNRPRSIDLAILGSTQAGTHSEPSRRAATVKIEPYALVQTKKSRGGGMATQSSQRSVETARSVGSLATALFDLNLQVFPQDGTNLPSGEPLEIVQVLQGGLLREKAQCVAREMEIRDLKDKLKDAERSAEISSADALSIGKKNQELEETIETLRLEMVMAINGARVTARWELMRVATEEE
ncbi:hypothetical protein F2Q68_00025593 [Brassica cretica]|uniref:Uncharacterized protein n=1 Tax=Brassica cretica TaxID=69181 RepID=A0A8S9ILF6_BRACR|nr:hypothetical protein F2Q68_00025593 [Brassica cretica]